MFGATLALVVAIATYQLVPITSQNNLNISEAEFNNTSVLNNTGINESISNMSDLETNNTGKINIIKTIKFAQ